MHFLPPSESQERDLWLKQIANQADLYGLVELRRIESKKIDLYPENERQEIYDHNVRIFQSYVASVLLQDLALPDEFRDYLLYTVGYCERYLCGELSAEDEEEDEDEEVDDFGAFIS